MKKQNETPYYLMVITSVLFAIADVNIYSCNNNCYFNCQ